METPRGLWALFLLLLASNEAKSTSVPRNEGPRNACKSLLSKPDPSDLYYLNDTAQCFAECRQVGSSDSCAPGNLERHWLHYESYLVENSVETVDRPFVKSLVQNVSMDTSEDLLFSLKPSQIPRQVMKNEDKPSDRVWLPKSFFGSLPGNRPVVRLAITVLDIGSGNVFKGPRLLQEEGGSVLNNHVVGLSVGQAHVTGLPEPLEITFSHQRHPSNMTLTCVFWDVTKGPTGDWASRGCSTQLGAEHTVCHCDHLTFFALLLRPILDRGTVAVLTRISQVGCGVSMIFLVFAIILYIALRLSLQRFKSEDAPKIHVSLSSSLFLLNLTFLVSVGSGSQVASSSCWVRGAMFHYCLLCTFTWMGLEAFHLYLLSIRVFNTYFGHYFLKLSLAGWGLPALVVIGTGSANSYGLYTIRDQENRTSLELCWFQKEPALYATVHGYFLITFLFGAVVLALVAWKIFTLSHVTAGKERGLNWKAVLTVLGLSSLVGMTWGLAILTPLGLSTIYIFTFFNSLQAVCCLSSSVCGNSFVLSLLIIAPMAPSGCPMWLPLHDLAGIFIFSWFTILYFPSWSSTSSSGTTARLDQAPSVSHE